LSQALNRAAAAGDDGALLAARVFGGGRGEVEAGASEAAAAKAARAKARHERKKERGRGEEEEGKKKPKPKPKQKKRGRRSSFSKDLKAARASMLEAAPLLGEGDEGSSSSSSSQCGYLQKRSTGGFRKAWQTRYFVVAGHYLKYYADSAMRELKAALDLNELRECRISSGEAAGAAGRDFTLVMSGAGGEEEEEEDEGGAGSGALLVETQLRGPTAEETDAWLAALAPFAVAAAAARRAAAATAAQEGKEDAEEGEGGEGEGGDEDEDDREEEEQEKQAASELAAALRTDAARRQKKMPNNL
jgi:hypothetical protein